MQIFPITELDRNQLQAFIRSFWHADEMVTKGRLHTPWLHQGYVCKEEDQIVGAITYQVFNQEMEITLLDSRQRNRGYGTKLVEKVILEAKKQRCKRVWCMTTNDNMPAMGFFQKRGFEMVKLHLNSMEKSRKLKPGIPLTGAGGIPIKHEVELEMVL